MKIKLEKGKSEEEQILNKIQNDEKLQKEFQKEVEQELQKKLGTIKIDINL